MTWRKSSFSARIDNCVEVRSDLGALRDTKNPTAGSLQLPVRSLVSFARSIHQR